MTHVGPAQRPRRAGRTRRGRARQRTRRRPEAHGRAHAQHGRDQGRHPRAAGQPAGGAGDRPAHLAPHRPHALGRALADRDQDLRRRPRRAARPGRCAAREAGHHPGPRRPADREAGAGAADQGAHRLRRGGAVRRAGAAGAVGAAGPGRRREDHPDRRGQPALRAGGEAAGIGALGRRPGPDPDRDAERPHPAVEDRQHRRRRRSQPDQPRRRQAAHRAVGQRVGARAVGDRGRHPQGGRRDEAARGLLHHPGRPVPGAGRGVAPDRPAVHRVADLDVRGALQPLQVAPCCRR